MNTIRPCGCKGVRTCLECETDFNIAKPSLCAELQQLDAWSYCVPCRRLYPGWDPQQVRAAHPKHNGAATMDLSGVLVQEHFLRVDEGATLMAALDRQPWTVSQSGRRKQNYGPKTNFKKRKLHNGSFAGFPSDTEYVQQRLQQVPVLADFQTIEQCSLEYEPTKGASIDPHIDDCWIWGERVVTVNCLGDAVLTLTLYDGAAEHVATKAEMEKVASTRDGKYNLDLVATYAQHLVLPLDTNLQRFKGRVIRIPMPNLSLIVLYGPARFQFEHCVLREDITERRVCIAYREFTPMYIAGGAQAERGEIVTRNAQKFWT